MASGVAVGPDVQDMFDALKMGKGKDTGPLKYMCLKINTGSGKVEIERVEEGKADPKQSREEWEAWAATLPEQEGRFYIYDFAYNIVVNKTSGGKVPKTKILLISWVPDTASVRQKMLYSSTKEALRGALVGWHLDWNCCDADDVDFQTVYDAATVDTASGRK